MDHVYDTVNILMKSQANHSIEKSGQSKLIYISKKGNPALQQGFIFISTHYVSILYSKVKRAFWESIRSVDISHPPLLICDTTLENIMLWYIKKIWTNMKQYFLLDWIFHWSKTKKHGIYFMLNAFHKLCLCQFGKSNNFHLCIELYKCLWKDSPSFLACFIKTSMFFQRPALAAQWIGNSPLASASLGLACLDKRFIKKIINVCGESN